MQLKDEAGRTQHQDEQEVEERAQQRAQGAPSTRMSRKLKSEHSSAPTKYVVSRWRVTPTLPRRWP